jgi:hypothetical protein
MSSRAVCGADESSFAARWIFRALLLALLLPVSGLFSGCQKKQTETPDLIVLQTGRLRGNIYPLSLQDIAPLQYYPLLAGYIRAVRAEADSVGAEVLLLDLGDSLDGSFASLSTQSQNVVRFFNILEYDAILLGNLDNDVSPGVLEKINATKLSPFLGPDGRPAMAGTSVAAILPPDENRSTPVYVISNFYGDTDFDEFPDRFPSAFGSWPEGVLPDRDPAAALAALGERPPGALTLFAWMKFEDPKSPPEEFLSSLREAGVDAVVAHRVYGSAEIDRWAESGPVDWNPPVSQNILRQNAGFSIARMDLKKQAGGWKVLQQQIIPMIANNAQPDESLIASEEAFADQIRRADRVLGELAAPWEAADILQSFLVALTEIPRADVVVYSPQSVRADFPAGTLTSSRLFGALPWNTPVVSFELPAALLPDLMERNSGWSWWGKNGGGEIPTDESVTIVTSRFFATILRRQSGLLPPPAVAEVAPSEFEFFQDFLKDHEIKSPPERPSTWSDLLGESR